MKFKIAAATTLAALCLRCFAAEDIIITDTAKGLKPIPIALAGFTGEAAAVLKFDLEVMGFEAVTPEKAQFLATGNNSDHVEGRLVDQVSKTQRFGKRYSGGNLRLQTHAFADEIVQTLTGRPGIARTKIVFKGQAGGNSEIYVADYDGANAIAVTQDRAIVASPCWTPDHQGLYYTSYRGGFPDIYFHNLATGERTVFAKFPGLNTSATVSPDGRRVAMILSKAGSPDLYVADRDMSNLKRLTTTKEDESSPCWAPDSKTICFVSRTSGRPWLYKISADGGAMQQIKTIGAASVSEPSWSPDGKAIICTAMRGQFQLCIVDAKGGTAEDLIAGEDPSWAPNSRTVIFTRTVNHRPILSLLDVPTKRYKDVHLSLGSASQAAWAK